MFSTHSFYLSDIGNTASQREPELLVSGLSPLCVGLEIFGEAYGLFFYFSLSTRRGHLSEVSWRVSVWLDGIGPFWGVRLRWSLCLFRR